MEHKKDMGFYIHHIDACYSKLMTRRLKEFDITPSQFEILRYLVHQESQGQEVIQKDLEQYFHISNPTVSGMISRLEQKGFVQRVRDDRDRRTCLIQSTPEARRMGTAVWNDMLQTEDFFTDHLGQEAYDGLIAQLDQVLDLLVTKSKEDCA